MFTNKLAAKFVLAISCLIFVASFLLSFLFIRHQTRIMTEGLENRTSALARNLAYNAEYGVLTKNYLVLDNLIASMMKEKDVIRIEIRDKAGELLSFSGEKQGPLFEVEIPILTELKGPEAGQAASEELLFPEKTADQKEPIGSVQLAVSLTENQRKKNEIQNRAILTTFFIIAGAIALTFFLVRTITSPLRDLVRITEKVSQGELDVKAEIQTKDEIGELACAFNRMTASLKKSRDEILFLQNQMLNTERLAAIGEIASGMAHELKNPLGVIKNALFYIDGALRDSPVARKDPDLLVMIDSANRDIGNLTRIINDLLDFSRPNGIEKVPTDLSKLIEESERLLEARPNTQVIKDIRVSKELMLDSGQMSKVFANLGMNAIQAMANKGGRLTIRAQLKEAGRQTRLLIEFIDTGEGITQENLDAIFQPLFTTKAKGTGLGLPICKQIIEKHGGTLSVSSRLGEGTTFAIDLPVEIVLPASHSSPGEKAVPRALT